MSKKTSGRVVFPQNTEELLDLSKKVFAKHTADGASSPLNGLQDHDWADVGPKIEATLRKHLEAEDLRRRSEEAYKERDLILPAIKETLRASALLLKGANAKNPKRLGEWGFEVNDTPPTSKKTPPQ